MYPALKVKLNEELDKKICMEFLSLKKAGVDFGKGIVALHPKLIRAKGLIRKNRTKFVNNYVKDFYENHVRELKGAESLASKSWELIGANFFSACERYFGKYRWPKGRYIAYLSIFNCNPRFLEEKTFQVYWKHPKGFVSVAAHEMLHFLFYDFVEKNFPNKLASEGEIWQLSEITNYFLLGERDFIKITKDPKPDLYPQLNKLVVKLLPVWGNTRFLPKFLKLVLSNDAS